MLTTDGIEDVYIAEGGVNGEVFLDFVRKSLLPILMPFDGLNTHSVSNFREPHNLVRFLPTYSPDMNPIEVFSEVKQNMQANCNLFQATSAQTMILTAFATVSVSNCNAHAVY